MRLTAFVAVVCGAATLAAVWAFELSFERALLLAPVLVVGGATVAGLLLLWSKALVSTLRGDE
jgi:hypothetical protein